MIAWIEGKIFKKSKNHLLVKTEKNIAYEILVGENEIQNYKENQKVSFFIFALFKEKWFEFYSFQSLEEKEFFQSLLGLSGMGPKSSYKIIKSYGLKQIIYSINNKDTSLLEKITGIGKKTAAKIIIDLEKKASTLQPSLIFKEDKVVQNVFSALENMGIDKKSILQSIQKILKLEKNKINFNSLLKSCLKDLKIK